MKMTDKKKFDLLYQAIKEHEDQEESPLYFPCGVWFNTSDGYIDMEAPRGALVSNDFREIENLLSNNDMALDFKKGKPVILKVTVK